MLKWTVGLLVLVAATGAGAENPMKLCGAKYQAAKADGSMPAGQTWPQFLKACRATLPKAEAPAEAATGAAPTGAGSRMKQCAAQYHADKDAGKLPAGQTWPRYYSACAARLKG